MTTFEYVEDYILFMSGLRDLKGATRPIWDMSPVIKLANYDISPLSSFCRQITQNVGFTDRQATLALNIIRKYERQLNKLSLSIAGIEDPKYRMPLRIVDRSKTLTFDGERFYLRFPFNGDMVDSLRDFAKTSKGRVFFDNNTKAWTLAATEDCLNFAHCFALLKDFDIDEVTRELYHLLRINEDSDYAIELRRAGDSLEIRNASKYLIDYIEEHEGGFGLDNLLHLVDIAPTLGITVSDELLDGVPYSYYATKSEIRVVARKQTLEDLAKYAKNYKRLPIYVLGDAHYSDEGGSLSKYFAPNEIVRCYSAHDHRQVNEHTKVIFLLSQNRDILDYVPERIPLLVSHSNMMFGINKSILLQRADKICYYCDAHLPTTRTRNRT